MKCIDCKFYDVEDDRCSAFSCDPFSCDDPLPCEKKTMKMSEREKYEMCWLTGNYTDQNCEWCNHSHECSGSD